MQRFFISDLHLSPGTPELAKAFSAFLANQAKHADELYILGDFFDAWIGDDEDHEFYTKIIHELRATSDSGTKTYFLHGNRDFLIGKAFAERCNITLLSETHSIVSGDKTVLLMHGDSLCTSDQEYMAFRAQVRNPAWQAQILALPLEQRRVMAAQLRNQSSSMNSNKAEDIMDVNQEAVCAQFTEHSADILLHGHTHRPATHTEGSQKRIVLGDWGNQAWYVHDADGDLSLNSYGI
ncbi:MAG: UDP-2,3-diacylglucosamine hydrolase [Flavobacteriales bacterium]|jgi:UDP-2,3-diacylglucosamine hydrolase